MVTIEETEEVTRTNQNVRKGFAETNDSGARRGNMRRKLREWIENNGRERLRVLRASTLNVEGLEYKYSFTSDPFEPPLLRHIPFLHKNVNQTLFLIARKKKSAHRNLYTRLAPIPDTKILLEQNNLTFFCLQRKYSPRPPPRLHRRASRCTSP